MCMPIFWRSGEHLYMRDRSYMIHAPHSCWIVYTYSWWVSHKPVLCFALYLMVVNLSVVMCGGPDSVVFPVVDLQLCCILCECVMWTLSFKKGRKRRKKKKKEPPAKKERENKKTNSRSCRYSLWVWRHWLLGPTTHVLFPKCHWTNNSTSDKYFSSLINHSQYIELWVLRIEWREN